MSEYRKDILSDMNFPIGAKHTYPVKTKEGKGNFGSIKSDLHTVPEPDKYTGKDPCKSQYSEFVVHSQHSDGS